MGLLELDGLHLPLEVAGVEDHVTAGVEAGHLPQTRLDLPEVGDDHVAIAPVEVSLEHHQAGVDAGVQLVVVHLLGLAVAVGVAGLEVAVHVDRDGGSADGGQLGDQGDRVVAGKVEAAALQADRAGEEHVDRQLGPVEADLSLEAPGDPWLGGGVVPAGDGGHEI